MSDVESRLILAEQLTRVLGYRFDRLKIKGGAVKQQILTAAAGGGGYGLPPGLTGVTAFPGLCSTPLPFTIPYEVDALGYGSLTWNGSSDSAP